MAFNPHFILLRLRNASFPELLYRLGQDLTRRLLYVFSVFGRKIPCVPQTVVSTVEYLKIPDLAIEEMASSLSDISDIIKTVMAATNGAVGNSAEVFPGTAQIGESRDIRLVWEPARLQQAMALLVWVHQQRGGDGWEKASQCAKRIIFSWLSANPFPSGVHYQSAMECALRIIVFFTALKRIDSLTREESTQLYRAIYQHAWLVSKQLSLYSSLGNHTIAEAVGLVVAGAVYKRFRRGQRWLATGIRLLDQELHHQILDDGGPAEQSISYHRYVLDLYWLATDFIHKNNLGDVHHWSPHLEKGEFFIGAFQEPNGRVPAIGDSDDGFALGPGLSPFRKKPNVVNANPITFADSGYTIIRKEGLVFTFDHGPLGMAPFFNHGHADALSITLSKNGYPLLVDPGTYRYNGVPQWRRYFKGTRAHNTVTIDDQDQAVQETSFIWSKSYDGQLTAFESANGELFYNATHNGYLRLQSPVRHHRSVFFFEQENFLIRDRFIGTGRHCFQINFHFHPDAVVDVDGPWWVVEHRGERIFLRLLEGAFETVRGRINPLMGWFSNRYGQKEPTSTLTCTRTGASQDVVLTTVICTRGVLDDDRINIKVGEFASKINNS